jgi:hypothetical protein
MVARHTMLNKSVSASALAVPPDGRIIKIPKG